MVGLAIFMTIFTVVGIVAGIVNAYVEKTRILGFLEGFLTFAVLVPLATTLFFGMVYIILCFWIRVFTGT